MVRIRMQRLGRRHRPFYRINVVDIRTRRDGKVIEQLGWFNPTPGKDEKDLELNGERAQYWLGVGAQPSDTVRDMLAKLDLLPPKMKAKWESDRAAARNRVEAKTSLKTIDGVLAELAKFGEKSEIDPSEFQQRVESAKASAEAAVSAGDSAKAKSAADEAEAAWSEAKAAEEKKQAEKAAAEAAAKEAESAAESSEESAATEG